MGPSNRILTFQEQPFSTFMIMGGRVALQHTFFCRTGTCRSLMGFCNLSKLDLQSVGFFNSTAKPRMLRKRNAVEAGFG